MCFGHKIRIRALKLREFLGLHHRLAQFHLKGAMGVKGLQRLQSNPILYTRLDLGTCQKGRQGLVIDGESFLYYIDARVVSLPMPMHAISGGCLLKFCQEAEVFINRFIEARIPIWFVFDGILDDAKRETRVSRRRKSASMCAQVEIQLQQAMDLSRLSSGWLDLIDVANLRTADLCKCALIQLLHQMGVSCRVAMFEADNECVRLCDQVNGLAVLAQDSDYLIFDTCSGYVPFSSLIFDDDNSVQGKMFSSSRTADFLGVHVSYLPVIAGLCGNDAVTFSSQDLVRFQNTLRMRKLGSGTVVDQILAAAKSYNSRNPGKSSSKFLDHMLSSTLRETSSIRRLKNLITTLGIHKYCIPVEDNPETSENKELLKLHRNGSLASNFAIDVYVNRSFSALFGVGYSSPIAIKAISVALEGLRNRICHVVLWHVEGDWKVHEVMRGLSADLPEENVIASANRGDQRTIIESIGFKKSINIINQCSSGSITVLQRAQLMQFIVFGIVQERLVVEDVFELSIQFLMSVCPGSTKEVTALSRMFKRINGETKCTSSDERFHGKIEIDALLPTAIFRNAFQLITMVNTLLCCPVSEPEIRFSFDGEIFFRELIDVD